MSQIKAILSVAKIRQYLIYVLFACEGMTPSNTPLTSWPPHVDRWHDRWVCKPGMSLELMSVIENMFVSVYDIIIKIQIIFKKSYFVRNILFWQVAACVAISRRVIDSWDCFKCTPYSIHPSICGVYCTHQELTGCHYPRHMPVSAAHTHTHTHLNVLRSPNYPSLIGVPFAYWIPAMADISAPTALPRSRFLRHFWSDLTRSLLYLKSELGAT